jgi:hypothetical protein
MHPMNAALWAVRQGWKIVPALVRRDSNGDKDPRFPIRWGTGSTTDEAMVKQWWVDFPDATVAILTKANNLIIVDLDCHGDGQDGVAEWCELVGKHAQGEFPATLEVKTPSGGRHLYFRNTDQRLKNSASKLANGVDIRGAGSKSGGLVFFGARYDGEYEIDVDLPVADLPQWLHDLLLSTVPKKARERDQWALPNADRKFTVKKAREFTYNYGLSRLKNAQAGQRNNELNNAAICLGHFGPDFWPTSEAFDKLREIARNIGLEADEIEATIQSGYYDAEWVATLLTEEQAEDEELEARLKEERMRRLVKKTIDQEELDAARSIDDMLVHRDELDDIPDVEALIDGFLFRQSVAVMYGRRNVGKTFVALDMALSVATGRVWGRYPSYVPGDEPNMAGFPAKKGKVLWIAGEGVRGIRPRVATWEAEYDVRADDFTMVDSALELASEARVEQLAEIIKRDGYDLIVVDTLARNTAGLEENSGSDMKTFFAHIDRLKNAHEGACVLIVHHQGKSKDVTDARGHTVIEDAPESVFRLSGDEMCIFFETTKQRDAVKADQLLFHLEDRNDTTGSAFAQRGTGQGKVTGDQMTEEEETRAVFMANFDELGCTTADWKKALMEKLGCSEPTARRRINKAIKGWSAVKPVKKGQGYYFEVA